MNPLFKPTSEESEIIEFINNFNLNEFAVIRMTETMIGKSIIDASEGLRKILFENKLVDFDSLIPGGAKEYKKSLILGKSVIETKVSFYRPKTKKGDPRFWIYDLKQYTEVNDLIYLTISNGILIAIPIKSIQEIQNNIKDIFDDIEKNETVIKLKKELNILKLIGFIESVVPGSRAPKDVGLTLERFLKVEVNNLITPDYLGKIELKSKREGLTKDSLFSKIPDKDISKYQTVNSIISRFGRLDKLNRTALYNNIITKPNSHGLYLYPDNNRLILYQKYDLNQIKDEVCAWHYQTLKNSLETKHPTTLWVDAEEKVIDGKINFLYRNFILTTKPVFSEFISLIERDLINFDWKGHIMNGKKRDHGPGFRIDKGNRKYLFKTIIKIV